jgi:hypothetical protein
LIKNSIIESSKPQKDSNTIEDSGSVCSIQTPKNKEMFRVQGELQNPIPSVTYTNHEESEHLNWNMCFSSKLSMSENQVYEKTGKLRDDATDKRCNNKLPHWNSKRSARPEE